jgi:hypothetical protein
MSSKLVPQLPSHGIRDINDYIGGLVTQPDTLKYLTLREVPDDNNAYVNGVEIIV